MIKSFYEPEKNRKKTWNFDTGFWEQDQSIKMNTQVIFPFSESMKKSKINFPIDDTVHFYPYKTFKKATSLPKTFKIDFYKLYKGYF